MKKKNKNLEDEEVVLVESSKEDCIQKHDIEIKPVNFDDFYKEINEVVNCRKGTGQEIFLPFSLTQCQLQHIFMKCREKLMVNWHVIVPESTEEIPEPEIRMYWDQHTV